MRSFDAAVRRWMLAEKALAEAQLQWHDEYAAFCKSRRKAQMSRTFLRQLVFCDECGFKKNRGHAPDCDVIIGRGFQILPPPVRRT